MKNTTIYVGIGVVAAAATAYYFLKVKPKNEGENEGDGENVLKADGSRRTRRISKPKPMFIDKSECNKLGGTWSNQGCKYKGYMYM